MKKYPFLRKIQTQKIKQKQIQKEEPQTPKQKIVQSIQKNQILQCYVCLEEFNSQDRLPMFTCLNCLDIVCQRCLNQKQRSYQKKMLINRCNKCTMQINVDLIKKCLPLINLINIYQKIKIKEKQYRQGVQYLEDQLTNATKKINQCQTNHLKQLQIYKKQNEHKQEIIRKQQKQLQKIKKQLQSFYKKDSSLKINVPQSQLIKQKDIKYQLQVKQRNKQKVKLEKFKQILDKKKIKIKVLDPNINEDYFKKVIQQINKIFPEVYAVAKKQQVKQEKQEKGQIQGKFQFNFIADFQQNRISDPMQYIKHLDLKYLNVLSLNGNNISDKGFAILAQMDLSHLDVLSLSNNSLKDLPGISRFTQLQTLNLLDSQQNLQGQTFSFPNKLSQIAAKQLVKQRWQYLKNLTINFVDFKPRQMRNVIKQPHKYQNRDAWKIIIQNSFSSFPSLQKIYVGSKKMTFLSQQTFTQLQKVGQQTSQHTQILLW